MKKLTCLPADKILPIILFAFLFLVTSNTYAQSSDCWKEFSDAKAICDQAVTKQSLLDKCDQANNTVHQCLGLDKNPWKLESSKPGYLTCQEWKKLMIAGTAQNCIAPLSEIFEKKLWCLSSVAEMKQVRSHPVDYILDFDPNSCIATEDDLRQFKEELPLTPGSSSEVSQNTAKNSTEQKNQPKGDKENLFKKALGGFPVFIGEWFKAVSTGMDTRDFFAGLKAGADEYFTDDEVIIWEEEKKQEELKKLDSKLNSEALWQFGVDPKEILERKPKVTWVDKDKLRRQKEQPDSPFKLDILNGQAQIKYPGEKDWKPLAAGDKIPSGSTLFTGMDTTTVLSIKDKGVVQILPFTEITVSEQGLEQATKERKTTTDIDLRTGEIELNVEGNVYTGTLMNVSTPQSTTSVRGTHFWVSYNKDKRLSIVGVYKGQVEVKTSGNDKPTLVSPKGDPSAGSGQVKPGVVLVTSKLSLVKLTLAGLVLAAVIGGAVFFLKRKGMATSIKQKARRR